METSIYQVIAQMGAFLQVSFYLSL